MTHIRQTGQLFEVVQNGRVLLQCGLVTTAMTKVRHMERERCHICFAPCDGGICDGCRPVTAVQVTDLEEEMQRRREEEEAVSV